jgi:hypoxanthine phosphoribosyltransferase
MDDVIDTGVSLAQAAEIVRAAGAAEVLTVVFARKPWPSRRAVEPDDFAWDAPARFLVGYGMDLGGRLRDLPYVAAAD